MKCLTREHNTVTLGKDSKPKPELLLRFTWHIRILISLKTYLVNAHFIYMYLFTVSFEEEMKGLVLLLITLGLAKSLSLDTEDTEVKVDQEKRGKRFSFYFN